MEKNHYVVGRENTRFPANSVESSIFSGGGGVAGFSFFRDFQVCTQTYCVGCVKITKLYIHFDVNCFYLHYVS